MDILKVPKDPSMGTPPKRTNEISSFFPQHENEAINSKLLFRAFISINQVISPKLRIYPYEQ